jgi:ABC-type uncharacterized transport system substrate-binding protein
LVRTATIIAVLVNPATPGADTQSRNLQAAARVLGLQIVVLTANTENDIDAAFTTLVKQRAGALLVVADPVLFGRRDQFLTLAARNRIPAIYPYREFSAAGGLMSYGTSLAEAYRQQGLYVGRVLKGEKPADLPVLQSTKVELTINLKTAKALGITFDHAAAEAAGRHRLDRRANRRALTVARRANAMRRATSAPIQNNSGSPQGLGVHSAVI